ncbi:MAG TPA: hypothetical protein VFE37_04940 [Chloroflexota bacterium]|nr:hypothetical protein [Chloroflexota bacterium]
MMTRDALYHLIDELPDDAMDAAAEYLAALRDDPLLRALLNAPWDDEPETEAERLAAREAEEDFRAGRTVSLEQLQRELGL